MFFIMHNGFTQKYIENNHLKYFFNTVQGKIFLRSINCIKVSEFEGPDYKLISNNGVEHGLEETIIFAEHPVCKFFTSLDNIVKKVFKKLDEDDAFNKKFFITLLCDEKDFDLVKVKFKEKDVAEQIFSFIKQFPNNPHNASSYEFNGLTITGKHNIINFRTKNGIKMKVIYSQSDENYNFGGTPVINFPFISPIEAIQDAIDSKNKKYSNYKNKCNGTCNLLLVYDPFFSKGFLLNTEDKVYNHIFTSEFDNVFLLELGGKDPIKVTKLLTSKDYLIKDNSYNI